MTSQEQLQQARKSALMVAVVLLGIAAWNLWQQRPAVAAPTGLVALLLFLLSRVSSAAALAFHRVWMRLAHALGWINSRILLSVMFYGIITPYGLVLRLLGRNPLRRRGPGQESYWLPREKPRQPVEQFERLF